MFEKETEQKKNTDSKTATEPKEILYKVYTRFIRILLSTHLPLAFFCMLLALFSTIYDVRDGKTGDSKTYELTNLPNRDLVRW